MKPRLISPRFALLLLLAASTQISAQSGQGGMELLFANLQAEGRTPRDTIVELVDSGIDLDVATAYTVANSDSIGLAVAYAHEGVCLAEDQLNAEKVAENAVNSATEQSRNAVQARVTETLNNRTTGACDLLVDERNTASQAFAPGGDAGGAGTTAGGGAIPPPVDTDDGDVSASQ